MCESVVIEIRETSLLNGDVAKVQKGALDVDWFAGYPNGNKLIGRAEEFFISGSSAFQRDKFSKKYTVCTGLVLCGISDGQPESLLTHQAPFTINDSENGFTCALRSQFEENHSSWSQVSAVVFGGRIRDFHSEADRKKKIDMIKEVVADYFAIDVRVSRMAFYPLPVYI